MKITNKFTKALSAVVLAASLVTPSVAFASTSSTFTMHVMAEATKMSIDVPMNAEIANNAESINELPIFMNYGFAMKLHSITNDNGKTTYNFEFAD